MEREFRGGTIKVVKGNLLKLKVDAVVNAANSELLGGGGVNGAIQEAAGPKLLAACMAIGGCPVGDARITPGFDLKARWVIHAVGPIWQGGGKGESRLLAGAYRASMELAQNPAYGIEKIVFPAISTGIFGFPADRAATIAIDELDRALAHGSQVRQALLVSLSDEGYRTLEQAAIALLE